jgi:hypothetical protein
MHRNWMERGRSKKRQKRNKSGRTRNLSTDTRYKNQNYNKPNIQRNITPFYFVKRCNHANRIYRQKEVILQLREELSLI